MKTGSVLSIIFIPLIRLTNHHEYLKPPWHTTPQVIIRLSNAALLHACKISFSVPPEADSYSSLEQVLTEIIVVNKLLLTYFSSKAVECELSFLLPSLVVGIKMDALPKRSETSNRIRPLPALKREKFPNKLISTNFINKLHKSGKEKKSKKRSSKDVKFILKNSKQNQILIPFLICGKKSSFFIFNLNDIHDVVKAILSY